MRVVFMGTPEFAVPALISLISGQYEVVAVYTQPDKPSGRGQAFSVSPVKKVALNLNLPVMQPEN
ncbi:MAG: methionyl-tRNA formyltransferase, partial [Dehalococcoidales bacterium]|nr:methionyl-tRNA formyltransferase [Dehalococcoidales bacterium]